MSQAGVFLIGVAAGLLLGAFATYGMLLSWAMRYGEEEDKGNE